MKVVVCSGLILFCSMAFGRAGTGAANAQYALPKSLLGLCTQDSKDEPYYKEGYCLSLDEQLKKDPCTKDKVAELRSLVAADPKDPTFKKLQKQGKQPISLLTCQGDKPEQNMSKIAMNKNEFNFVLEQIIAMATIKTSGWNVLNGEQSGSKGPGGLLNLSLEKGGVTDMENKDYACGCKDHVATTSGQSGVTVVGQSPGPLDGHHSMTCGAYMIISQILKDGSLGGGERRDPSKPNSKDTRYGGAKIVSSLERTYDADGGDPNGKWYDQKMKTFCKKYWQAPASQLNEWNDDIRHSSEDGTPATS